MGRKHQRNDSAAGSEQPQSAARQDDDGCTADVVRRSLSSTDVASHVAGYLWGAVEGDKWRVASLRLLSRQWSAAFGQFLELSVVPPNTAVDSEGRRIWMPRSPGELLLVLLHLDDGITLHFQKTLLFGLVVSRLPPLRRVLHNGESAPPPLASVRYCRLAETTGQLAYSSSYHQSDVAALLRRLPNLSAFHFHGATARVDSPTVTLLSSISDSTALGELDVSGMSLTSLPENLRLLQQLKKLDVSHNPLKALPAWIGELTALEKLESSGAQLSSLPESMRLLRQLRTLNVSFNPLKALPVWIGDLTALEELDAAEIDVTRLAASMRKLRQLKSLNVGLNPLNSLPPWIGDLTALEELSAVDTGLTSLPENIRLLQQLKALYIPYNPLKALPPWIGDLTALEQLDVSETEITSLPESMRMLRRLKNLNVPPYLDPLTMPSVPG